MDIAIEKGLCAEPTKVGSAQKTPAYAIARKKLQKFICAIFFSFVILGVLGTIYFRLFLDEKARNSILQEMESKGQAQNIRMSVALQAALSQDDKDDHIKSFNRINRYIEGQLSNVLLQFPEGKSKIELENAKASILTFVDLQLRAFLEDLKHTENQRREKLGQVSMNQMKELHQLLNKLSGIRLQALEEMLEDLFQAIDVEMNVELSQDGIRRLDNLIEYDLFEHDFPLQRGKEEALGIFRESGYVLPEEIEKALMSAKTNGLLATILDEISESAKLAPGRAQLEEIRSHYLKEKQKWDHTMNKRGHPARNEVAKITVETVLKVQELVNQGVVPMEYLDFADLGIDASDYYDDRKYLKQPVIQENVNVKL